MSIKLLIPFRFMDINCLNMELKSFNPICFSIENPPLLLASNHYKIVS